MMNHREPTRYPIETQPGGDNARDDAALLVQRRRVHALKARECELHELREQERNLEVERIAAEVALRALTPTERSKRAPGKANEIFQALDHVRALECKLSTWDRHRGNHQTTQEDAQVRLQAGLQALRSWLEAPRLSDLQRTRRAVRAALVVITFAAIGTALTVHPALLVLLLPVGPILVLLRSGQDIEWRRLGAKRRFKETSLEGPMEWTEPSVRLRIAQLRAAIGQSPPPSGDGEPDSPIEEDIEGAALAVQLADENQNLARLLVENGLDLDDLDGDLERQLRLLAEVERSQRDLIEVQEARMAATAESNEAREELFAYLARQDAAPPAGQADTAALAEKLERLIARRHARH